MHFITIAMGSCYELDTQAILSNKFGYISIDQLNAFAVSISEVQKMLFGFYKSLNKF